MLEKLIYAKELTQSNPCYRKKDGILLKDIEYKITNEEEYI